AAAPQEVRSRTQLPVVGHRHAERQQGGPVAEPQLRPQRHRVQGDAVVFGGGPQEHAGVAAVADPLGELEPEYTLVVVGGRLDVVHEQPHRALPDDLERSGQQDPVDVVLLTGAAEVDVAHAAAQVDAAL